MKKLFYSVVIIWILVSVTLTGNCQYNLVQNPSFEMYGICPGGLGQLTNANFWTEAVTNVSPEFFHACANIQINDDAGVPQNKFGFQNARTGLGYGGICTEITNPTNPTQTYREYIQTELIDFLLPGVQYTVSFYVSAADSCGRLTNNFGAYFSNIELDSVVYPFSNLSFQPQIENPPTNDLGDRIGWTPISGTFIANGGEKFIIIGNFRPHQTTTVTNTGWGTWPPNMASAYLYIDDILVTPTDSLTSIYENNSNSNEGVFLSTIADNQFVINSKNHTINSYEVANCLGQIIDKNFTGDGNSYLISMEDFATGIYFIRIKLNDHNIHILKIFKT